MLVAGCGRIGFDPRPGRSPGDDSPARDAAVTDAIVPVCKAIASCPGSIISTNTSGSSSYRDNATLDRGLTGSCGGAAHGMSDMSKLTATQRRDLVVFLASI